MYVNTRYVFQSLAMVVLAVLYANASFAQGSDVIIAAELSPWLAAPVLTALSLIAVGLLLMLAEALIPGAGILGFAGIIAFMTGGLIIAGSDLDGAGSSWPFFIGLGIASVGLLILTAFIARKIRGSPIVTGQEEMLGQQGAVISIDDKIIYAQVRGEKWQVASDTPLSLGQIIRVQAVNGLMLKVIPVAEPSVMQAIRSKRS